MRLLVTIGLIFISFQGYSQDTNYLKIHFLYGSKPLKEYKATEKKWFGGILGGHVGIESDSGRIVNFVPKRKFHLIAKNHDRHSAYEVHSVAGFYSILGGNQESAKIAIVHVPVSEQQRKKFDSISVAYLNQTPYDYAFLGMRCGAATYEILAQLGILKSYSQGRTSMKIFYPKKLRKRLFKKAAENNWTIVRQAGSGKRKWERD
jgi:hypothetical protein